jgi:hypothetical protein
MPGQDAVSFAKDIAPLFRDVDVDHMEPFGVLLNDYEYMKQPQNAKRVRDFITGDEEPRMPPGGPFWSDDQVGLFDRWVSGGYQP